MKKKKEQDTEIIDRGAEAIILRDKGKIIKKRVKKKYRHKKIDQKLRKKRTRWEGRNMERVKSEINIPQIFDVNEKDKEISMEFIEGDRLSEVLNGFPLKKQKEIIREIGEEVSKMHQQNIIHGDLTTSNMILNENNIYFIDFGLSFHSLRVEDRAVDIHLLRQALEAKHFKTWKKLWKEFKENYNPKNNKKVLERLKKVESRGRYK